ncbi:hypothetical protein SAMN06265338_108155 [Rhodoblastus acidophilus]|uniref:Uncharacterized protein n=1 Tax=Rhodoblastus acidophilus TaxID=1074 RepID=A0A212RY14_RHOAC|nr:hypothetical protein [Rhodoblastus acidophilus]PPQ38444.1 hypothetical protein CKO16_10700 [Rhodoblastus acidophilus]RAI17250.1 hypothetical protein CH337_17125 [Rhodoblastus acidophilus]SNB77546.1 hypothetical protein SAMN06265338_108155 [Rhodoblastus acidophilus]
MTESARPAKPKRFDPKAAILSLTKRELAILLDDTYILFNLREEDVHTARWRAANQLTKDAFAEWESTLPAQDKALAKLRATPTTSAEAWLRAHKAWLRAVRVSEEAYARCNAAQARADKLWADGERLFK